MIGNACCIDEDKSGICDSAEVEVVEKEPLKVEEPAPVEPVVEEVDKGTEVTVTDSTPPPVDDPAIAKLIEKSKRRVKSLRYTGHIKDTSSKAEFFVKGNLVKVNILDPVNLGLDKMIDTLYFDTSTFLGHGRCQRVDALCKGSSRELFDVDYDKYYTNTPMDWLQEFATTKPTNIVENSEIIEDRRTTKLTFDKNGAKYVFWVDEFYGVPIQIEETKSGQRRLIPFTKISFNTVSDDDVGGMMKRLN